MSMPEFPKLDPDLTQEQALTMILSSIALEEVAFSHIINAEGEKIQYALGQTSCGRCPADIDDVLAVNKSVAGLLEMVMQNQLILKNKMEKVLEHLPRPPRPPEPPWPPRPPKPPWPPKPPCPPEPPWPPRPPKPPWPPEPPCPPPRPPRPPKPPWPPQPPCSCESISFEVVPKAYRSNEPLQWRKCGKTGNSASPSADCTQIQVPPAGSYMVEFHLDTDPSTYFCGEAKLAAHCKGLQPVMTRLYPDICGRPSTSYKQTTARMPCSCCPPYISLFLCAQREIRVRRGRIVFTKL